MRSRRTFTLLYVCLLAAALATGAQAQPQAEAPDGAERAEQAEAQVMASEEAENQTRATSPVKRYLQHFLAAERELVEDLPLWLVSFVDDIPDRVEAEVNALQGMEAAIRRVSTYDGDDIQVRLLLTRPSWSIIIPIR